MWVTNPTRELWTGTEEQVREAQLIADKINAVDPKALMASEDDDEVPSMLVREGNVGVISISGPLFASVPTWAKAVFGVRDYGDIADALIEGALDQSIGAIMLDVSSPGGAVSGVDTVANLVKRVDREIKPVVAHTDSQMASAAYWISAGAREISAGTLAVVGSIGVLQVHTEHSRALEMEGTTVTVMRAGKYKALGNPYEPLSDAAKAEIQSRLDYTYGMFMGHVADSRGMNYDTANAKMGEGRVFVGAMAKDVGLVDKISDYSAALTNAQQLASKHVDARKSLIHNPKKQEGEDPMRKKAQLTEAQIAALQSGVPLEALETAPAATDPAASTPEPTAAPTPTPEPTATDPTATDPAPEPTASTPVADQSAVVALLQSQLAAANDALLAARVDASKAADRATALESQVSPLATIAREAVAKMYVALGADGAHVAALSTDALLAEHAKVSMTFKDRFKVGGVAAPSAPAEDTSKAEEPKPRAKARLQAVRIATK